MHHSFLDRYSSGSSLLHRSDTRMKIVMAVIALMCLLTLPNTLSTSLAADALLIAIAWGCSGLPLTHMLKRLALALPFIALIALSAFAAPGGSARATAYLALVIKAALAILVLTLLTSTTPFPHLLRAFSNLGMPRIMNSLLAFLYRYIYIIFDEGERLSLGRQSRQLASSRLLAWKSRAWMIGTLFLRSLDRSERVYQAMLARGFTGEIRTLHDPRPLTATHVMAGIVLSMVLIGIRLLPRIAAWTEFSS